MDRSRAAQLKLIFALVGIFLGQLLLACTPAADPAPLSAPLRQPTLDVSAVRTPTTRVETTDTPFAPDTPLRLSANAKEELAPIRAAARNAGGGFLFYLDAPGRTSNPQVFQVSRGQPFEAVVLAGNYGVKEHAFALLCIVDYIQTPCHRDGKAKSFQFSLASQAETLQKLSLPLAPGAHDLVFLTFYDPSNHSVEQTFRQESRFLFAFYRAQIRVGKDSTPPVPPRAEKFSTRAEIDPGAGFFTILRDKFIDPAQTPWHREDIEPGALVNFTAAYSNPEPVTRTVALLAFMDFEQVPWNADQTTLFAELEPGARADIPAAVTGPSATGEHELVVVAIDNPFLDLAAQVEAETPRSFFANSSDRVLIVVR